MRSVLLWLCILPVPVWANGCQDLWFTRNMVMDRAGYCFGSELGRAVFDNADCTGKDVTLAPAQERFVQRILALEASYDCKVDTGSTSLDLDDLFIRRNLIDLPIRDELEGGCLGWRGPRMQLFSGTSTSSPMIGQIWPGDYVSFAYVPENGWGYVTTYGPNWVGLRSGGWLSPEADTTAACPDYAG